MKHCHKHEHQTQHWQVDNGNKLIIWEKELIECNYKCQCRVNIRAQTCLWSKVSMIQRQIYASPLMEWLMMLCVQWQPMWCWLGIPNYMVVRRPSKDCHQTKISRWQSQWVLCPDNMVNKKKIPPSHSPISHPFFAPNPCHVLWHSTCNITNFTMSILNEARNDKD